MALLLGCFEGAPPQSKGCASLNSHSTKVLVLCFSIASKEPRHNRKWNSANPTIDQGGVSLLLGCLEEAPPQSKGESPEPQID